MKRSRIIFILLIGFLCSPLIYSQDFETTFQPGWNWFSVNVKGNDMSLGNLLNCANDGDYIKGQTRSATYYAGSGWFGSLDSIKAKDLHLVNVTNPCTVSYQGLPVDAPSTPIELAAGWNWIGYLPQDILPISDALGSLNLEEGDYIKNQSASATYYDGSGWFGNLTELVPASGYMIRKESEDVLIYPGASLNHGGVVLTFDDLSVPQWMDAESILSAYNWKATFCITAYDEIDEFHNDIIFLRDAGHEIGGHGLRHVEAVPFVEQYGMNEYLNQEIIPMIDSMEADGLQVPSFAYPFGSRNETLDAILLNYFEIVRGVGWEAETIPEHSCFFDNSPLVYGFGIDSNFSYFSEGYYEEYILDLLRYARDNNRIIVLMGHETVESITDEYQVTFSILESICNFINENGMEYYTLSELSDFIENP